MLFNTGARWDKSTAGIHAVLLYGSGYWDFQALAMSVELTEGCKLPMTELSDGSDQSWYYVDIPVPSGGPYAVQILLASGEKIGDAITPDPSVPAPPATLFDTGARWDAGTAGIYAVLLYGAGYWDFQALAVSPDLTATCKLPMVELPDGSAQSWYHGTLPVPFGGPYPVQIRLASGEKIGDDITPAPTVPNPAPITGKTLTRDQLAIRVLGMLGVYDRSTPEAEDVQNVLTAYDGVYEELKDDGLVTWVQSGEDEAIPVRFGNSLAAMVAATPVLLTTYPQPTAKAQLLMLGSVAGLKSIRRQLASAQDTETTVTEYF